MLVTLSGVMGFCKAIADSSYITPENRDKLLTASKLARDVMESIEINMDEDQLRGVLRFADNCALMVLPKTSPQTDADLVVVSRSTVSRIVDDALSECFFCDKTLSEAKKCQRRKDLLECGALGCGGSCPFNF